MERIPVRDYGAKRRADAGFLNNYAAKTAAYTIPPNASLSGTVFTNRGAAGGVTITLPIAPVVGERYEFFKVVNNQNFIVSAAGGPLIKSSLNTTGISGSTMTHASGTVEHGALELEYDGTVWCVKNQTGTWALT